jgi:hypothetical protein
LNQPIHRADVLFALPSVPRTAALYGELPGWPDALQARGIEEVGEGSADVAIATHAERERAYASGAASVVVDGSRAAHRELRARGSPADRLLSLPMSGSPDLFVNLAHRRAARYGIRNGLAHRDRLRNARNEVAGMLARYGLFPSTGAAIAVASGAGGDPAIIAAARDLGVARERHWVMLVSPGSAIRRNSFLLFDPARDEPAWALKFARVPGLTVQFEREARGYEVLAAAGGSAAARAPSYRGRVDAGGFHASLESAATGTKLSALLRRPVERERKLAMIERILDWCVRVAGETATSHDGSAEVRDELAREVVPYWSPAGVGPDLIQGLPPVPASLQHNDLVEDNIVMQGTTFSVLDWEWARLRDWPLVDLVHFAIHTLRIIDGAEAMDERERHFVALMSGRAPTSPVLFRWIRAMVSALALPADDVGRIVTLGRLRRGMVSELEGKRAAAATGTAPGQPFDSRAAHLWLETPGLGPRWDVWRR